MSRRRNPDTPVDSAGEPMVEVPPNAVCFTRAEQAEYVIVLRELGDALKVLTDWRIDHHAPAWRQAALDANRLRGELLGLFPHDPDSYNRRKAIRARDGRAVAAAVERALAKGVL